MVTGKSPVYRLNNGIEMAAFGLGVFRSEPEKTVAAVRSAVANGYRLIDTAAAYMNEQQVGEGIRLSGVRREDVFVTTKVWITDYGYDRTLRAFDRSLLRLGFDVLDLYLIHWPVPSAFEATIDAYKASLKLLEEGRVRAILRLRTCVGGSSGNQRTRHRRTWRTRPGAGESANLSCNQS
ncbi:aldo/keto reductase [Paraburkholderia saeva]|jgi:diketogulonate reductase-like aldo/keto reductase|uniref:aldo/keto reductase n=1 Tax=Paraburkholderia saeva TaxID=2777537 RepID=UPI002B4BA140|nr:aldo/keto reductase [Paraburkholderia saeva]